LCVHYAGIDNLQAISTGGFLGLAFATTRSVLLGDNPCAALLATWTTVLWGSVGALIEIAPMTFAILLALLCAARMILNGTVRFGASLAAMKSWLGDFECAALGATATRLCACTILGPAAFTIDCAWRSVALLLLELSITMGAVETALVPINEVVLESLPASTTFTRAITPRSPSTANMLGFHGSWSIIIDWCIGGAVTSTPCFFGLLAACQLALLICGIPDACLLEASLALLRLLQLGKRSALLGVRNPCRTASLTAILLAFLLCLILHAFAPHGFDTFFSGCLLALLLGFLDVNLTNFVTLALQLDQTGSLLARGELKACCQQDQ